MEIASLAQRIVAVHLSLETAEIPHAFGGAIALAYHTHSPRATSDIDLNIALPSFEAERVFRSLPPQVRWTGERLRIAQVKSEVRLRWMPSGPIDLFFAKDAYYDLVEERKELHRFSGMIIPVISATDLTVFKAIFNRAKDWVDIGDMVRSGTVDIAEALRWTKHLGGDDRAAYLEQVIESLKDT